MVPQLRLFGWEEIENPGKLMRCVEATDAIFDRLVGQLQQLLPGFGRRLAFDGKGIRTHARARKREDAVKKLRSLVQAA